MTSHVFVDETKAKRYLVAEAIVDESQLRDIRRVIKTLLLPGQRSVHMKAEGKPRRHKIADAIAGLAGLGVRTTIYDVGTVAGTDLDRRALAIGVLVGDIAAMQVAARIVFDMDVTLLSFDRQHMIEATRASAARDRIRYVHLPFASEPALAIPDVVAWCWARGGEWRERIRPIVTDVRVL